MFDINDAYKKRCIGKKWAKSKGKRYPCRQINPLQRSKVPRKTTDILDYRLTSATFRWPSAKKSSGSVCWCWKLARDFGHNTSLAFPLCLRFTSGITQQRAVSLRAGSHLTWVAVTSLQYWNVANQLSSACCWIYISECLIAVIAKIDDEAFKMIILLGLGE